MPIFYFFGPENTSFLPLHSIRNAQKNTQVTPVYVNSRSKLHLLDRCSFGHKFSEKTKG
jgi:hypothetical protein